jgi:hypothetical protein
MRTARRGFLAKAGGALTAVALGAVADAPVVIAQPKVQWRMSTAWTPMARKVYASFTKFQALVGAWDGVAEGAYHRLVAT